MQSIQYTISPALNNQSLNHLFEAAWPDHSDCDFQPILSRSLAYLCAWDDTALIGFVNLAWDGGIHAFLLDTTVHPAYRRRGIGQSLVRQACATARDHGITWVHVDFEDQLADFYYGCGFQSSGAGVLNLTNR